MKQFCISPQWVGPVVFDYVEDLHNEYSSCINKLLIRKMDGFQFPTVSWHSTKKKKINHQRWNRKQLNQLIEILVNIIYSQNCEHCVCFVPPFFLNYPYILHHKSVFFFSSNTRSYKNHTRSFSETEHHKKLQPLPVIPHHTYQNQHTCFHIFNCHRKIFLLSNKSQGNRSSQESYGSLVNP